MMNTAQMNSYKTHEISIYKTPTTMRGIRNKTIKTKATMVKKWNKWEKKTEQRRRDSNNII